METPLTYRRIAHFWSPLAATWLMMAVEGPLLSSIIARMADPTFNLAAYGVALPFAMVIESPIIMMLTASNALVRSRESYRKLRRFLFALNTLLTLSVLVLVIPQVFELIAGRLMGLPREVVFLSHRSVLILLPWPAAIGYRRFFQGILVSHNMTRRVAYGTLLRVSSMAACGVGLALSGWKIPGAWVGAISLSVGVTCEAIASRFMAWSLVQRIKATPRQEGEPPMTLSSLLDFYLPLAMTSLLGIATSPITTFFLGHSRRAVESLAVAPVLISLLFIFRSGGMAYQEVGVALLGEGNKNYPRLKTFAIFLGGFSLLGLTLLTATPLSSLWFRKIVGLSPSLAAFALTPARIMTPLAALEVLISLQRSLLINRRKTRAITVATAIEVTTLALIMAVLIGFSPVPGAIVSAIALLSGRVLANLFLFFRTRASLPGQNKPDSPPYP